MEQMEVTPVPLDDNNSGNVNFVNSNSLITNEVNYLFNPSVNAIAMQSENDKSVTSVNEGPALGTKTNNNSSVPCQSEKLPEIFKNMQLSSDMPSAETAEGNTDLNAENGSKGNETVMNEYDGSCKSGFHVTDEECPTTSVTKSAIECPTEVPNENIQYVVCNTDINSSGCSTACVSENSTVAVGILNNAQVSMDGATKVICEEQTVQSCKSETECDLNKRSTVRKECEVTGKHFQFDSLQKQSSEIKERVMGFLTKYTNIDEAFCSDQPSVGTLSKEESVIGKQSQVINERNIGTKIVYGEQCETQNPKKILNDVITQNVVEIPLSSPQIPKFHFASVSKSLVTESYSQTSSIGLPPDNMSTQLKDAINKQTVYTTIVPHVPPQNRFISTVLNNEPLSSTSNSTSCENKCNLKTLNNIMESHEPENTPESNSDVCVFHPDSEIALNNFELKMTQNSQPFISKSNLHGISVCGTPEQNAKGMKQQNKSNTSSMSFEFLAPCSNDVFGNKIQCSSSQKNVTSPSLNAMCMNQVTCTLQRSTNTDPVNSWLSWGRISGELHTTSSINSPILSSKSSNDPCSSKYIPFSNSSLVSNIRPDNTESAQWSTNNGSKSRRTKSSDAFFTNCTKPFSSGETAFASNTTCKLQKCDNSSLVRSRETDRTNLSYSSVADCGNSSNASFIPQNNNRNSHGMFVNWLGTSSYSANGETLESDYKCFERPFVNNMTKGNMENPFIKKSPIESIGLFKSPVKSAVSEVENSPFKPVSSLLLPLKREKEEEYTGIEDMSGILKPAASNDPLVFPLGNKNKQNQTHTSTEFSFRNLSTNESLTPTNKQVFSCGRTSIEDISEETSCGNSESVSSQINSNSLFQFTFTPDKSKTFCTSRVTWPRSVRKSVRTIKQFEKDPLKDVKGSYTSNVSGKGTEDIPFKPVYGSDIKFEKGIYKNIIVRYQNIVFMDDYAHVSPEEIRSQFYTKAVISGPFKFGACIESDENNSKGFKKTQSQEIQTDEHLTSKNPDLAAIWRVLECPVCLDVVLPPVYQCEQGHHACATCWTKVLTCPLCKRPQSCTRNYMAEALVEQVPLPCRYHIEGCKETVQHNSKVNHEENCSYRMYQCPVSTCNQALSYQNMCKHFKKHHKNILHHEGHSVGKGEKFCDVLYKEALSSSLVHAFDITKWGLFFLREVAVGHSTAFFVQVMPAASDQAAYFYHLEVCDHHDCRKECFKGRVFHMCKPSQEIIDQEEYLCLSELILKTVKKTTPLKIVVTIWQLKPAFTLSS